MTRIPTSGGGSTAARLLVVAIVLVATLSTPTAAQRPVSDRFVLTDHEQIETVTVDGNEYAIYAYDSPLPYVGGITVYRSGEPVRSKETVKTAITTYARRRALTQLRTEELEAIRRFERSAEAIERRVGTAVETINATLAYRKTLKNASVGNRTAMEASVEASPAFEKTFTSLFSVGPSALGEVRNQLQELDRAAAKVDRHAGAIVEIVQKRRQGAEIDQLELFHHYTELLAAVKKTATLSDQLDGRLATIADRTRTITTQTSDVPKVADGIAGRMETLRSVLRPTSEQLGEAKTKLRSDRKRLKQVDQRAKAIAQRLLAKWETGGTIKAKIYGSIGEGALVLLAGALAVVRVRRE